MPDWSVEVRGWKIVIKENLQFIARIKPKTGIGVGVKAALKLVHRLAVANTHVDTAALKYSHRIDFREYSNRAEGNVYVSNIRNPKHGLSTMFYGPVEDDRGGDHAFYGLIFNNEAERVGNEVAKHMMRGHF